MQRTELVDGALVVDGIVIGTVSGITEARINELEQSEREDSDATRPTLTLNLGWAKAAGLRVVVHGEPGVDRQRGGVVLDR